MMMATSVVCRSVIVGGSTHEHGQLIDSEALVDHVGGGYEVEGGTTVVVALRFVWES